MEDSLFRNTGTQITGRCSRTGGQAGGRASMFSATWRRSWPTNAPNSSPRWSDKEAATSSTFQKGNTYYIGARSDYGDTPALGEWYGRWEGTGDHSVNVETGQVLKDIDMIGGADPPLTQAKGQSPQRAAYGIATGESPMQIQIFILNRFWPSSPLRGFTRQGEPTLFLTSPISPRTPPGAARWCCGARTWCAADNPDYSTRHCRQVRMDRRGPQRHRRRRTYRRGNADSKGNQGEADPLHLRPAKNPKMSDWTFVQISVSRDSVVEHCIFEYAFSGLQVHYSKPRSATASFATTTRGSAFPPPTSSSSTTICWRIITASAARPMARAQPSPGTTFRDNEYAFFPVRKTGASVKVFDNNIEASKIYQVNLGQTQNEDLDFTNNWWGSSDAQVIAAESLIMPKNRPSAASSSSLFEPDRSRKPVRSSTVRSCDHRRRRVHARRKRSPRISEENVTRPRRERLRPLGGVEPRLRQSGSLGCNNATDPRHCQERRPGGPDPSRRRQARRNEEVHRQR